MTLALTTVVVDLQTGEVLGGSHGPLTDTERRLLAYLATAEGRVVPRTELLQQVWQAHPQVKSRMVDRAVARLRKKLGDDGEPRHLLSVYGEGYRLVFDAEPHTAPLTAVPTAVPGWALPRTLGPCVARSDALSQLHPIALGRRIVRVAGPHGVGRFRVLVELAWRQRARFPGGVYALDGHGDLAEQLAALPPLRGASGSRSLADLARPAEPRLALVRHLDDVDELPDVDGLSVWGTTVRAGDLRLAPLTDDDARLLLRELRLRAMPGAPWGPHAPEVEALVAVAGGLPGVLVVAEGLSRTLPTRDVVRHLAHDEPVEALLAAVVAKLPADLARAAHRLAALGAPLEADDLPDDDPLRKAARALVDAGLMPPGPRWQLAPSVAGGLRRLDEDPAATQRQVAHTLAQAVLHAQAALHRGEEGADRLARLASALLHHNCPEGADRVALAMEAAATLLARQHTAAASLQGVTLGPDGVQARGRLLTGLGRHDEARSDLQGPPRRADSGAALARMRAMAGDLAGAWDAVREAHQAPGDSWHLAELARTEGGLASYEGDWARSMAVLHGALEAASEAGDRWAEARLLATLGHVQAASGDAVNGRVSLERAAASLEPFGDRRMVRLARITSGQLALADDETQTARSSFEGALDRALADHDDDHVRMAGTLLALACLRADDDDGAQEALRHVAVDTPQNTTAFRRVERLVRAWSLALQGQSDAAARSITLALTQQPQLPHAPARALAYLLLAAAEHPAAQVALDQVRHDVQNGDQEHAGVLAELAPADTPRGPRRGVYAHLAARWRRRATARGWRPSAWAANGLAEAVISKA